MKNIIKSLPSFFATIKWCLNLSWRSSKFYTTIRIAADIITPLLAIVSAFVGKHMLDLLSGAWEVYDSYSTLALLFAALLAIAFTRMISRKTTGYSQAMQSEMINGQIAQDMMHRALSADLEYFDNPEYYDRLQSATQDSMAVSYILWNVLSCISAGVSFIAAFAVLYTAGPLYGLLMMAAAIPASIAAAKYTKILYMLSLEQINEQRQMNNIQSIATNRIYAQDMRLFNAADGLKDRYRRI